MDYGMDLTRHEEWVKQLGTQRGAEFSHMMHERKRLLGLFQELCVLVDQPRQVHGRLQQTLPLFSGMVKDLLWREVLMGLSRYGDTPQVGRLPISLRSWLIRHTEDLTLSKKNHFQACVKEYEKALRPIKRMRDHYLAHSDARNIGKKEPRKASFAQVEGAFMALEKALRTIAKYHGIPWFVDMPYPSSVGGAESFILLAINSSHEHP